MFEVLGEFERRAVTARGFFLQAPECDGIEIASDRRIEPAWRRRFRIDDLAERDGNRFFLKA